MAVGKPEINAESTHPSFRLEDQEMARELEETGGDRVVIGPPAYASPDPATAGGRLVPVEVHPLGGRLSEDFGGGVGPTADEAAVDAMTADPYTVPDTPQRDEFGRKTTELPADRDEWSKADWQRYADSLGLGTSGSKKVIIARVEKYETEQEEAEELVKEIKALSREDLDKRAEKDHGLDPEEFSTKEELQAEVIRLEVGEQA
jgi:hypothetical protein